MEKVFKNLYICFRFVHMTFGRHEVCTNMIAATRLDVLHSQYNIFQSLSLKQSSSI